MWGIKHDANGYVLKASGGLHQQYTKVPTHPFTSESEARKYAADRALVDVEVVKAPNTPAAATSSR